MIRSALVVIVLVAGCASGKQQCVGSACHEAVEDLSTGTGGTQPPDMSAQPMPDIAMPPTPPDMTKLLQFGDPCQMNAQCDSGICLQTNNGSFCTQVCGNCPTGYGCYGVTGAVTPGTVTNVCAPENNLLCTACSTASDCGASNGADYCLPYTTGTFCGRDCSTIGCPPTFNCVAMSGGDAGMIHQCVPANNACDCTQASNGRVISCTIKTSLGTMCPGTSTCNGATGWGTCTAPSTDDTPDDNFTDSNCDGIDGNIEGAVFVDGVSGNDANPGTMPRPVATIAQGMTIAKQLMLTQVYVSKGTYNAITLSNGISLYGGYDAANKWQRSNSNTTTITNGVPAIDAQFISKETHVELFTIAGGTQPGYAGNSYGVRIANSSGPVVLHASSISSSAANNGFLGTDGQHGLGKDNNPSGINFDGMSGNTNSNGTGNYGRGGDGGSSYCSNGGHGGYGADSNNGGPGDHGYGVTQVGGGGGGPVCNSGNIISCDCSHGSTPGVGNPGDPGGAGSDGSTAAQLGSIANNDYTPANGANGANGIDGSGGSGGGAGGGSTGSFWCDHEAGGGGGGGGAGGCHGLLGFGGGGGGASFAVFAISSTVTVDKCVLTSGSGGAGGKGGNGGVGGAGGGYGNGGGGTTDDGDGQPGARGGSGGKGGNGGSGSGGTGGPSAGIGEYNSNVIQTRDQYNVGSGGSQGIGGNNGVTAAPNGYPGTRGNFVAIF